MKHSNYKYTILKVIKKIFLISLVSVTFFSLGSCKKEFLDVVNTQNLYEQSYVKDLSSMQEYINGNYVVLARYLEEGNGAAYPELVSDNMKPLAVGTNSMNPHYGWAQVSDAIADFQNTVGVNVNARAMDPLWAAGYRTIRACNFAIEDVDKYHEENPQKANDIKGQAYAIRAYLYFKLVNTFAQAYKFTPDASHPGVPYITTSDITKPFTRQTVAEVYAGMIDDLNNAIQLLPATVTDVRIMNRTAAKALLARVYLFKEDFANAKLLALEICNQVPLMTIQAGYPDALFKFRNPSQTETLFQLSPRSSAYITNFLGRYLRLTPIRYVATNSISLLLTEKASDARKSWIKDTLIGTTTYRLIKKFPASSAPEVPGVTPNEIAYSPAIIRSSEMFLTVAEASARSGDDATAKSYLDFVRKRADLSAGSIDATGPALIDSIYKERRKELAFESLRMFDLQRWKLGVSRSSDVLPLYPTDLPYPHNKAIAPIPYQDVQLAGLPQNPGY